MLAILAELEDKEFASGWVVDVFKTARTWFTMEQAKNKFWYNLSSGERSYWERIMLSEIGSFRRLIVVAAAIEGALKNNPVKGAHVTFVTSTGDPFILNLKHNKTLITNHRGLVKNNIIINPNYVFIANLNSK